MTVYTPNLPALIADLPGDDTRAPQTEFTRDRQVRFLENLSLTGSVRSAASAGGVSHQTAYRARRATREFRTAWDAALLAARVHAEEVLACRAIDGVEEKVFYHGEQVDTRVRYSDRLLLAHLARLDRLTGDAAVNAVAEDFDAALARFAAGEDLLAGAGDPGPEPAENLSPGPCNTRSMSPPVVDDDWDEAAADAEIARIEAAMAAERPADAPPLTGIAPDGTDRDPGGLVAEAQWEAFARGAPRWWLVVPPMPVGEEEWRYADPATLAAAEEDAAGEADEESPEDEDWDEDWDDEVEDCRDEGGDEDRTGDRAEGREEGEEERAADDLQEQAPPAAARPRSPDPRHGPWVGAQPIDEWCRMRFQGGAWGR